MTRRTLLQRFLGQKGIPSARLEAKLRERLHGRTPSRQQLYRWRSTENIRRKDMVRILWAARELANDPDVQMAEIFDLDPENESNWRD
jgi:hypothetical protein